MAADPHDGRRSDGGNQADGELEPHVGHRGALVRARRLVGVTTKARMLELLTREGLDGGNGRQCLLDRRHHPALEIQTRARSPLHRPAERDHGQDEERRDAEGQQRQGGLERPHDGEHRDERDERLQERQQRAVDEQVHAIRICCDAGDGVADRTVAVKQQ